MMEGAEESASTDLEKYLEKYRDDLLPADLLVWEQGNRNSKGQLEITGGNKGLLPLTCLSRVLMLIFILNLVP